MSFLSIAFLTALPLVAAPLLLHLLDRRRNVVIEWGAMEFLREAATARSSARRLKQWLLLLLRTLAIAALVLALAQPTTPYSWWGEPKTTETIFVIDNSMSMSREQEADTLLKHAVDQVRERVDSMNSTDFVRVMTTSPSPRWVLPTTTRVDSEIVGAIDDHLAEVKHTNTSGDILSSLFLALNADPPATLQSRKIVVLSDAQAHDWKLGSSDDSQEQAWRRLSAALQASDMPTEVEIMEVPPQEAKRPNLVVHSLRTRQSVVGVNRNVGITVVIENLGAAPSQPCHATWSINDEQRFDNHVPSIDVGNSLDLVWEYSFEEPGTFEVGCEIDARDVLTTDNRTHGIVEVASSLPVLLVEDNFSSAELQRDAFFVEAGLGWIDGQPSSAGVLFEPTIITSDDLARTSLSSYRCIVIPNLVALPDDAIKELTEYVSQGGGLWIAAGPRTDLDRFNSLLHAEGQGLSPLPLDQIVFEESSEPDTNSSRLAIDTYANNHPASTNIVDDDRLDLSEVTFTQRFRFASSSGNLAAGDFNSNDTLSSLLTLTNGEPLAVEKFFGQGRVIVQAVPLKLQWSSLAKSQAFVVMLHDWLGYLSEPTSTKYNLAPGEPIAFRVTSNDMKQGMLNTPAEEQIELSGIETEAGYLFRSSHTKDPGLYRIEFPFTDEVLPFHVSRPAAESEFAALSSADRDRINSWTKVTANAKPNGSNPTTSPLWPLLLMLLAALILGELIISGMISRERFGIEAISESNEPWLPGTTIGAARTQQTPISESRQAARQQRTESSFTNKVTLN